MGGSLDVHVDVVAAWRVLLCQTTELRHSKEPDAAAAKVDEGEVLGGAGVGNPPIESELPLSTAGLGFLVCLDLDGLSAALAGGVGDEIYPRIGGHWRRVDACHEQPELD